MKCVRSCENKELASTGSDSLARQVRAGFAQMGSSLVPHFTLSIHGSTGVWPIDRTFAQASSVRCLPPNLRYRGLNSIGLEFAGVVILCGAQVDGNSAVSDPAPRTVG